MSDAIEQPSGNRAEADAEKLRLENKKLNFEIKDLERNQKVNNLQRLLPFVSVLVTILGFYFTIFQYRSEQQKNRDAREEQSRKEIGERIEQSRRARETAQQEFMKPLLAKQSELYFEASSAAATIASTKSSEERAAATNTFWRLYWGPLVFVENTKVSGAMKRFGHCLDGTDACDENMLSKRSLNLATIMEKSILASYRLKPENFGNDQFVYPEPSPRDLSAPQPYGALPEK